MSPDLPVQPEMIRNEAVEIVDRRHGYTMEFAPSPEAHREEYDHMERTLSTFLAAVAPLIAAAARAEADEQMRKIRHVLSDAGVLNPGEPLDSQVWRLTVGKVAAEQAANARLARSSSAPTTEEKGAATGDS